MARQLKIQKGISLPDFFLLFPSFFLHFFLLFFRFSLSLPLKCIMISKIQVREKQNNINSLDPTDLPSSMRYFPRICPNSLKISPKFRAYIQIQRPTYAYLYIKMKLFLLHLKGHFTGFNFIYWTVICGKCFLRGSILEKCGKICKNGRFSGLLRPDWGNTARAATAGLGSKRLMHCPQQILSAAKNLSL